MYIYYKLLNFLTVLLINVTLYVYLFNINYSTYILKCTIYVYDTCYKKFDVIDRPVYA